MKSGIKGSSYIVTGRKIYFVSKETIRNLFFVVGINCLILQLSNFLNYNYRNYCKLNNEREYLLHPHPLSLTTNIADSLEK